MPGVNRSGRITLLCVKKTCLQAVGREKEGKYTHFMLLKIVVEVLHVFQTTHSSFLGLSFPLLEMSSWMSYFQALMG